MIPKKTDVLIVGAGPIGLMTAIMLQRLGVETVLIERRAGLHDAPQAHVISARSMEICRSIGISDARLRAKASNPMDTIFIRWVDHLLGQDLGVYSMISDPATMKRMLSQTPTPVCNLSQDQFERVLFDQMPAAAQPLFEHSWQSYRPHQDGYISQIERGDGTEFEISSRFIIAADGAGSRVRSAIGAQMEGPDQIQSYVTIHFHADLRKDLDDRVGLLYWIMDPECAGCFIAHNIDQNWVYMNALREDLPANGIDESLFEARLRRAIGSDVAIDIKSFSTWRMTAQVSSAYQKDGVFLVGDAAHRFPPTGGLGMNTGIQDAHNLTWKIAMVLKGASPALLDTYETERRPSAVSNSRQSHENFLKMSEVETSLDTDGDGVISAADFTSLKNDPERQVQVQAAIQRQAKHFNMRGLDLGVSYTSALIVPDGVPPIVDDPICQYEPSTVPGTRLPHAWLKRGDRQISVLDLVRADRFLVLASKPLADAVLSALDGLKDLGRGVDLVIVLEGHEIAPADDQFDEIFAEDHILIVRPDGHIAARLPADMPTSLLQDTFDKILPILGGKPDDSSRGTRRDETVC
ncbi:MAG: FAD-dependent monooxygenase [Pseudomonadota bacterium]